MNETPDKPPAILDYATTPDTGGWPVGPYTAALAWAFVTLRLLTTEIEKNQAAAHRNTFRLQLQVALLACAAMRLGWAVLRKEKGNGWVFYVVLLFLAAPLWWLSERD